MKVKSKLIKPILLTTSLVSIIPTTSIVVVSCSNSSNENTKFNQEDIDKQYQIFNSSLVISKIKDNLYFENFDFENVMDINEVNKYISIKKLSNQFIYEFKANKKTDSVDIVMKVFSKNKDGNKGNELKPSSDALSKIEIKNVKSLSSEEKSQLNNVYNQWKNNVQITIKNNDGQTLNNKQDILPSYLQSPNVTFEWDKSFSANLSDKFEIKYTFEKYDDINGEISIRLDVINKITSLVYLPISKDDNLKIIDGFTNQKERSEEIKNIFTTLSQTIDVKMLANKDVPYIASGIISIDQIIEIMQFIVDNNSRPADDSSIKRINEKIDLLKNINNKWYDLLLTTSANDVIGTLNCSWIIVDKFTSYQINPQNINKTTTFNNLLKLVFQEEVDGKKVDNYSTIKNAWKAYNLLSKLEINDGKKFLPSSIENSSIQIDNNWLKNNTNINSIIPNINLNAEGYFVFSLIDEENNSIEYRFKIDLNNNLSISYNDLLGTMNIPFVMEINIKTSDDANAQKQWIKFLPATNTTNSDGKDDFTSADRTAFIKIGNFLDKDTQACSTIYQYFENNTNINIELDNANYYQLLKEQCSLQANKASSYFADEIKKQLLSSYNQNSDEFKLIESLLEKYTINLDIKNNIAIVENANNKEFDLNQEIEVSLQTASNKKVDYIKNGKPSDLPLINIKVSLI